MFGLKRGNCGPSLYAPTMVMIAQNGQRMRYVPWK